jgi:hypothetical protein
MARYGIWSQQDEEVREPVHRAGIVCSWTALAAPVLVHGYAISTMNLHAREESVCVEAGREDDYVCFNESIRGL